MLIRHLSRYRGRVARPNLLRASGPQNGRRVLDRLCTSARRVELARRTSLEFETFLRQVFRNLAAFSGDGSIHFICMDWRHVAERLAAGRDVYGELKNLCVWVKDMAGGGCLTPPRSPAFSFRTRASAHATSFN